MKIKRQDKLTVLSALLIGIIAGSYLYLVGFAPEFQSGQGVEDQDDTVDFMIVGEMYGGMRAGIPPSFQLDGDGSYRYVPFSDDSEVPSEAIEGALPRTLLRDLKIALDEQTLEAAARPVTLEVCAQMVDGIDYKYVVIRNDVEYELDTCGTDFQSDSPAGVSLMAVWDHFEETKAAE
jgi:hypothetical protein